MKGAREVSQRGTSVDPMNVVASGEPGGVQSDRMDLQGGGHGCEQQLTVLL